MNMENGISGEEEKEVMRIATSYFRKLTKTEKEAQVMLVALSRILKDEGSKLVHLGNVLFLVLVRGKGIVEIHTIGEEKKPRDMAKNFADLAKFLRSIEVKVAYTYAEDEKFKKLAKMVDLQVNEYKAKHEGKNLNVFVVEL
jgi:hypothetical protein